jgi:hypothetical protein
MVTAVDRKIASQRIGRGGRGKGGIRGRGRAVGGGIRRLPYHQAILNNEIPLSSGGGIGQSRTLMLLLRKAHLGEVSVTVWPKILKEMCAGKNIFVLE